MAIAQACRAVVPSRELCIWIGPRQASEGDPGFCYLNSHSEILSRYSSPSLIVLSLNSDEQDKVLMALRHNARTSHCLIFVLQDSPLSSFLSNGSWGEQYHKQYETYEYRKKQVKLPYTNSIASKLISYLWLHPEFVLQPHGVPSTRYLYIYPLLNAWGLSPEESFSWLTSLKRRGWIETTELVNRVRYCGACQSGHLNYIDSCPQCQSIDIELQNSLHCFNCGHIAKQDAFKRQMGLTCPNCMHTLRHIGVDYDRPIESQHCVSCDSLFVEAKVEAECLHCKAHNKLTDLHVRNVYAYQLDSLGRRIVRQGAEHERCVRDPRDVMTTSQFAWLVNWQNQLAKRHNEQHAVMFIRGLNMAAFIAREGEAKGFSQFDAIEARLRSILRETDVCCHFSDHGLLLFLPMTPTEHLTTIYSKLIEIQDMQASRQIELQVKAVPLPDDSIGDDVNAWLTHKLVSAEPW